MPSLKSLAKDTAIYGMSSIFGRFLNYLLVPLYTHVIAATNGGYGVVTNLYAFVALILVILTFGMETTFFRFANKEGENYNTVFSTAMAVIAVLVAIFLGGIFIFSDDIATALGQGAHPEYMQIMAVCVAIDAIQAIPFSFLRFRQQAVKFATLKLLFIVLNIGLISRVNVGLVIVGVAVTFKGCRVAGIRLFVLIAENLVPYVKGVFFLVEQSIEILGIVSAVVVLHIRLIGRCDFSIGRGDIIFDVDLAVAEPVCGHADLSLFPVIPILDIHDGAPAGSVRIYTSAGTKSVFIQCVGIFTCLTITVFIHGIQ